MSSSTGGQKDSNHEISIRQPSDYQIAISLNRILETSDLNVLTRKAARTKLEQELGADFSSTFWKQKIKAEIEDYLTKKSRESMQHYFDHLNLEQRLNYLDDVMKSLINRNLNIAQKDLINGYVKEEFIDKYNISYPVELNDIIIVLLGNILLQFDITDQKTRKYIQNKGTVIKITNRSSPKFNPIVCSGILYDKTVKYRIKCIKPSTSYDYIGICSNVNCNDIHYCLFISHHRWNQLQKTEIHRIEGREYINIHFQDLDIVCNSDDIITITLDYNAWNMTFYLNDKSLADSISIKPNLKYHLFISAQHCAQYELLP